MRRFIKKTKRNIRKIKIVPKAIALLTIFVVGIFAFTKTVFADQEVTFILEPDAQSYHRGDVVTIIYKFDTTRDWKNASAKITWDTTVFQKVTPKSQGFGYNLTRINGSSLPAEYEDFMNASQETTSSSSWSIPITNMGEIDGETGQFSGNMNVAWIKLKVKDDAPPGETTISFQDNLTYLEANDGSKYEKDLQQIR